MADARLHRTVAALRRAGCEVTVRGLSAGASASPGVSTSRPAGKVTRGLRALIWPWQARGDVLLTIDPDTALSAWLSSKVLRRRWVADVHEDYRELLRDRAWVPKPLLAVLRGAVSVLNWIITQADLVLVADEHVPPRSARRRFVMRNVPDVTLLPPMPSLVEPTSSELARSEVVSKPGDVTADVGTSRTAVYIGDMRESRGLRLMVEAVAATSADESPWSLTLVGNLAAADEAWFHDRLKQPDAARIRWHGRMAPVESWRIAEGAAVGLCLLADTPAFRDAMPSKVYEYLAMGMPTIATPLPRVRELVEGTGAGVIVDDVPATVEALRRFATEPSRRAGLIANARAAGEELRERPSPYDDAARRILQLAGELK
ncbi:MAG: glycosyltransferase [Propionibacteriaceae bacterium]|nr:glycosyltransferase [Propionibacteriaceae bacterium]